MQTTATPRSDGLPESRTAGRLMQVIENPPGAANPEERSFMTVPRFLLVPALCSLFALFDSAQIWVAMITHGHSFLRILFYQLCVWNAWGALVPLVRRLNLTRPLVSTRNVALQVIASVPLVLVHITVWLLLEAWIHPWAPMEPVNLKAQMAGKLVARIPSTFVLFAVTSIYFTISMTTRRLRDRELRALQLESELSRARLHALQLQIQPHFLFNTLHAVGSLVRTAESRKALETITNLSDLLRYSLDSEQKPLVPFGTELEATSRYLGIERVRFEDRLEIVTEIQEGTHEIPFPPLLLQPILENAVRHGMAATDGVTRIVMRAARDNGRLVVEVSNPGKVGQNRSGRGLGLANARRRLEQIYGGTFELSLVYDAGRVLTRVCVPIVPPEEIG